LILDNLIREKRLLCICDTTPLTRDATPLTRSNLQDIIG